MGKSRWAVARRAPLCIPEIVETGEKLTRRYVVNAPHRRAKWIATAIRAELTRPLDVKRPGIRAGEIAIPPEYWIAGRRSAVAGRRRSVLVPWFCCAQPILRGSDRACGEGDSVAYSASSGGVKWVERRKTHRMNQRRGGAGVGLRHEYRRQPDHREVPAFDH